MLQNAFWAGNAAPLSIWQQNWCTLYRAADIIDWPVAAGVIVPHVSLRDSERFERAHAPPPTLRSLDLYNSTQAAPLHYCESMR